MRQAGLILSLLVASGVAAAQAPALREMGPAEAIAGAAEAVPGGIRGEFVFRVRSASRVRGRLYLNSEEDYRDRLNLSIQVDPPAARALQRAHDRPPERYFVGKTVKVRGTAYRVVITSRGNSPRGGGRNYYQTRIPVENAGQILVVEDEA